MAARLAAQRLSGTPALDVVDATRHLLAVQGQDPRAARLALRARTAGGHASAVDHALTDERSLIITSVNRGTLHLIAAEDEPLLHALTTPQLLSNSDRRLRQEGVSAAAARRGITAIVKALGDDGPMTRAQLRAVLETAGVPTARQAMVHVLFRATLEGLIIRGPMIGREHAFALVADWLGERPKIDRDRALAELARRYLAGHGPAEDRDLAKWAQLPLRDARAGLEAIASELDHRPDGLVDLPRDDVVPTPAATPAGTVRPVAARLALPRISTRRRAEGRHDQRDNQGDRAHRRTRGGHMDNASGPRRTPLVGAAQQSHDRRAEARGSPLWRRTWRPTRPAEKAVCGGLRIPARRGSH